MFTVQLTEESLNTIAVALDNLVKTQGLQAAQKCLTAAQELQKVAKVEEDTVQTETVE